MKIGIDCRTILNPEKGERAGVGHYTYQLVRHLLEIDKKNSYFLFFDRSVQKKKLAKFRQNNVFIKFFPFRQYSKLMPSSASQYLVEATLNREKLDVFHSPAFSGYYRVNAESIVTVHDLVAYKFPEMVHPSSVAYLKTTIPMILRQARRIIAVSNSTAKDIKNLFGIDSKKIKVVFNGVDRRFFTKRTLAEIKKIKEKYKIEKDYVLFLGTLEERKNIRRLTEAYERFRNQIVRIPAVGKKEKSFQNIFSKYQLVLAGAEGLGFKEIKKRILASKYKKDIILPGYIKADDLGLIFSGASLFVFPSLYEGFGLPIIEAMAKKVPVVTSKISAMAEIAGKAAILVDPNNVAEIAQAIFDGLTNTKLRKFLKNRGQKLAKRFTWEKCATQTLSVYQQANKENNKV